VVVQNYDDFHTGWDTGRLSFQISNDPADEFVVTFKAKQREKMTSLNVLNLPFESGDQPAGAMNCASFEFEIDNGTSRNHTIHKSVADRCVY
jgi:hypothetical protein